MKKFRKILTLCCLACFLLLLLSGCQKLDEMRASQAFFDGDGNILWNDSVYKLLPQGEYFAPDIDYSKTVYVTEKDVPVLLQDLFAEDRLYATEDDLILESDSYGYYCREDRYGEIEQKLREPFRTEIVCYTYGVYDYREDEYVDRVYQLTQEQWDALQEVTKTVAPVVRGDGWDLSYDYRVSLYECSEDRLFQRYSMDLSVSGDTYYLWVDTQQTTEIYQVPESQSEMMAEILWSYIFAANN